TLEELRTGLHREKELRASEADVAGERLGRAVGPGQVADPLPENPAPPTLGNKGLSVARLQRQLQNTRNALVIFQVPDTNSPSEVQKFWAESDGYFGQFKLP